MFHLSLSRLISSKRGSTSNSVRLHTGEFRISYRVKVGIKGNYINHRFLDRPVMCVTRPVRYVSF